MTGNANLGNNKREFANRSEQERRLERIVLRPTRQQQSETKTDYPRPRGYAGKPEDRWEIL